MDKEEVKIIITNPMFISNNRTITVLYEDGSADIFQGVTPASVLYLTNKYNVGKVYIKGNKLFNKKLVEEIQKEEIRTYNEKLLNFEFIK